MRRREFICRCGQLLFGGALLGGSGLLDTTAWAKPRSPGAVPGRISIIIDDIGRSPGRLRQFLALGLPTAFAVLPRLRHSRWCAERVLDNGNDLFLHQPMEPFNRHCHPGPGAVYVTDDARTISRVISDNLSTLPPVLGVNNHMGSRFTARADKMVSALETIHAHGLLFVDSLTSARSSAYAEARQLGMPALRRHVFLDNDRSVPAIVEQLITLRCVAMKNGFAIGIGHPYPETVSAMAIFRDRYLSRGIEVVPVSQLAGCRSGCRS